MPTHSHYLQSKVFRALERIKAEKEAAGGSPPSEAAAEGTPTPGNGAGPAGPST